MMKIIMDSIDGIKKEVPPICLRFLEIKCGKPFSFPNIQNALKTQLESEEPNYEVLAFKLMWMQIEPDQLETTLL